MINEKTHPAGVGTFNATWNNAKVPEPTALFPS